MYNAFEKKFSFKVKGQPNYFYETFYNPNETQK